MLITESPEMQRHRAGQSCTDTVRAQPLRKKLPMLGMSLQRVNGSVARSFVAPTPLFLRFT
jgi:hypothetical protein